MSRAGSARRSIGGLCLAVAVVGAMVFGSPAAAQETEGLIPEGDWTDDQVQQMLDLIDQNEQVLPERFPAVATTEELQDALGGMGFHNYGATAPGGYDHWINNEWIVDDHVIDPELAESLAYQQLDDGRWQLVAAMYQLHPDVDMDEIPDDIAWLPGWHGHPELCNTPEGTFGGITDPDNPSCPPGTSSALTPVMMHVWIVDNECNHRFGGIGVEGIHCDVHGGGGGDHGGDHDGDDPGGDPGHGDGGHPDDGHGQADDGGDANGAGHAAGTTSPPARPITAQPSYAG